jgi:hypothetical protein
LKESDGISADNIVVWAIVVFASVDGTVSRVNCMGFNVTQTGNGTNEGSMASNV